MRENILKFFMEKMNKFFKGHSRTVRVKKNIAASIVIRGLDVLLSFLMVPLFYKLLGATQYGLWLTVISFIDWFIFLDIGLGHGLRNKYAQSVAIHDYEKTKYYVSTAYFGLASISILILCGYFFISQFVDWAFVFNVTEQSESIYFFVSIVFLGFVFRISLKLVNSLFAAIQKNAVIDFVNLVSKVLICAFLYFMYLNKISSLNILAFIYSFVPVLMFICSTMYFFAKEDRRSIPSLGFFKVNMMKDLMGLGVKFFVIQVSMVVLFASDNMIITHLFGPESVVPYQIAHKYFAVIILLTGIFIAPIWSSVTEAFTLKDFAWIKNVLGKYRKMWFLLVILAGCMFLFSDIVYRIWVGENIVVEKLLSFFWAIFVVLQTYNMIITNILNGIGKVKIQMYTAISSIFLNIPLSIFFGKTLGLGVSGVILATNISIMIYIVFRSIQIKKILDGEDSGIWAE